MSSAKPEVLPHENLSVRRVSRWRRRMAVMPVPWSDGPEACCDKEGNPRLEHRSCDEDLDPGAPPWWSSTEDTEPPARIRAASRARPSYGGHRRCPVVRGSLCRRPGRSRRRSSSSRSRPGPPLDPGEVIVRNGAVLVALLVCEGGKKQPVLQLGSVGEREAEKDRGQAFREVPVLLEGSWRRAVVLGRAGRETSEPHEVDGDFVRAFCGDRIHARTRAPGPGRSSLTFLGRKRRYRSKPAGFQ